MALCYMIYKLVAIIFSYIIIAKLLGTSCPGYELSWVRVVLGTSRPGYESSWVRVVLGTSCPGYELSWVRVVLGTSCPGYELSIIHVDIYIEACWRESPIQAPFQGKNRSVFHTYVAEHGIVCWCYLTPFMFICSVAYRYVYLYPYREGYTNIYRVIGIILLAIFRTVYRNLPDGW